MGSSHRLLQESSHRLPQTLYASLAPHSGGGGGSTMTTGGSITGLSSKTAWKQASSTIVVVSLTAMVEGFNYTDSKILNSIEFIHILCVAVTLILLLT
jgi:hypothetical protein